MRRFYYCSLGRGEFSDSDVNRLLDQTSVDVASKINSPIRYDDSRDLFNNGSRNALSLSVNSICTVRSSVPLMFHLRNAKRSTHSIVITKEHNKTHLAKQLLTSCGNDPFFYSFCCWPATIGVVRFIFFLVAVLTADLPFGNLKNIACRRCAVIIINL